MIGSFLRHAASNLSGHTKLTVRALLSAFPSKIIPAPVLAGARHGWD